MAILSVDRLNSGRDLQRTVVNSSGTVSRRYVATWQVIVDTMIHDDIDIIQSASIPAFLSAYVNAAGTTDANSLLVSKQAQPDADNPFRWVVTCEYEDAASPLSEPVLMSLSPRSIQRPTHKAWTAPSGTPVLNESTYTVDIKNLAGDPFEPPHVREDSSLSFKLSQYETLTQAQMITKYTTYHNTINATSYKGIAPLYLRCHLSAEEVIINGIHRFKVMYEFEHNSDTWVAKIMERGFRYKNGADYIYTDKGGFKPSTPFLLDTGGIKLADGGTPKYTTYYDFRPQTWAAIGI